MKFSTFIFLLLLVSTNLSANDTTLIKSNSIIPIIPFGCMKTFYRVTKLKNKDGQKILRELSFHSGQCFRAKALLIKKKVYSSSGVLIYKTKINKSKSQVINNGRKWKTYVYETEIYYLTGKLKEKGLSYQFSGSTSFEKVGTWKSYDKTGGIIKLKNHKTITEPKTSN